MKEISILGIDGSPHRDGHGGKLLKQALEVCSKHGAHTEYISLFDLNLPVFHGNRLSEEPPQGQEGLWRKIKEADAFIFSTPVHWFNVSASMKNFIDWLTPLESDGFYLQGKVAGAIVTCEEDGGQSALNSIVAPFMHHGVFFPPYSTLFYNLNMSASSENDWMNKDVDLLAANVLKMTQVMKTNPIDWGY